MLSLSLFLGLTVAFSLSLSDSHACEDDSKLSGECSDLLRDYRETILPYKLGIPMEELVEALEASSGSLNLIEISSVAAGAAKAATGTSLFPAGPIFINGEDAFVTRGRYAVMADGVSRGARSDFFAAELVKMVEYGLNLAQSYVVRAELEEEKVEALLRSLIFEAHYSLVKMRVRGAATLSLMMIDPRRQLAWIATLGDSQIRIVRGAEWLFISEVQVTGNTPFQLNGMNLATSSERAQVEQLELLPGDIIVMASDGLWDNLRGDRILNHLLELDDDEYVEGTIGKAFSRHVGRLTELARKRSTAREVSCDDSDDEVEACYGATRDDISVLASYIYSE